MSNTSSAPSSSESSEEAIECRESPDACFYGARGLPVPAREWWPDHAEQLGRLVETAGDAEWARLLLGSGEHLRATSLGERRIEVVRTEQCNTIRAIDLESATVRIECGVTWGQLHEALDDEGLALHNYRLYPREATIGGLLARWQPAERQFRTGDIREGCVALSTTSPARDAYDYLAAPRKASGPDFRHLYIGGEGALGAILEATLVVSPTQSGRLCRWEDIELEEALAIRRQLEHWDMSSAWSHWDSNNRQLQVALHGPSSLLESYVTRLRREYDGDVSVEGTDALMRERRRLESEHPARRSAPGAARTQHVTWRRSEVVEALDALDETLEQWEIVDWGSHHLSVAVTLEKGATWPETTSSQPMGTRPLREERREAAIWPEWMQRVKAELDPEKGLAVGP